MVDEEFEDETTVQPCTCRTPPRFVGTWDTPSAHEPGCAWRQQEERMAARKRERADRATEMAAHEGDDELVCPACGRPYALHGIGCLTLSEPPTLTLVNETSQRVEFEVEALSDPEVPHGVDAAIGLPLSGPIADPGPPAGEARFGKRLLIGLWLREGVWLAPDALMKIAAAIDRDADLLHGLLVEERSDKLALRRQIEEAVERLRYSTDYAGAGQTGARDVLDAEPFLEELKEIFAKPPSGPPGR